MILRRKENNLHKMLEKVIDNKYSLKEEIFFHKETIINSLI